MTVFLIYNDVQVGQLQMNTTASGGQIFATLNIFHSGL